MSITLCQTGVLHGMTVVSAVGGDIGGQPGFACTTPTAVQVRCELATLAVGASGTITIEVQVGSGVADGTVLDNVADVSTATPDPNPNNNTDNTDVLVVAVADLRITKSHPIDPVIVGTTMTFDIAVVNNGPSDAVADVKPFAFRRFYRKDKPVRWSYNSSLV